VLAAGTSARSLILLGDPNQLPQVSQGSHPEESGVSVLRHLLQDHLTIPPDRGLFLAETWRLHPVLCAFTSELFYEGRLHSRAGLEKQVLEGSPPFEGAGLWAVGFRAATDGEQFAFAEHYDGRRWTTVPIPSYANPGNAISGLEAVIAISPDDVWAVGAGLTTTADRALVEHWTGRRWTIVPDQPVNAAPAAATLVPGTHTVWVAGTIAVGAEENETFTERIANGRWRVVPAANPDQDCEHSDEFLGVAATAGAVWAVGFHFELLNGCGDAVSGSLIERY